MRLRLLTVTLFLVGVSVAMAAGPVSVVDTLAVPDTLAPVELLDVPDTLASIESPAATDSLTKIAIPVEEETPAPRDTLKYGQIYLEDGSITYTDEFLDTTDVKKRKVINDYTLIGIQYGASMNSMSWNPKMEQSSTFSPINIGVTWTRYGKIFGYMPYFGIQVGVFYTQEGYKLKEGYSVSGAREAKMNIVEVPALAHCHFDFWKMKFLVNIGFYVSYRLDIERKADSTLPPAFANNFLSTDHRWDYGLKGGGGLGFIFDPIEIHLTVMYKYGWGSLYDADYYSEYYYRFAHVSNLIFSIGVHYQITRRTGMTNRDIRKTAKQNYLEQKRSGKTDE